MAATLIDAPWRYIHVCDHKGACSGRQNERSSRSLLIFFSRRVSSIGHDQYRAWHDLPLSLSSFFFLLLSGEPRWRRGTSARRYHTRQKNADPSSRSTWTRTASPGDPRPIQTSTGLITLGPEGRWCRTGATGVAGQVGPGCPGGLRLRHSILWVTSATLSSAVLLLAVLGMELVTVSYLCVLRFSRIQAFKGQMLCWILAIR